MLGLTIPRYFFAALFVVYFMVPDSSRAASSIGSVTLVHEYAYSKHLSEDRKALYERDDVYQDEVVETISDGALHIEFVDETTLRLGSDSIVTLDKLIYDPESKDGQMVINLVQGVFRFVSGNINKVGVRVITPTLTIAIRGTDFIVAVDEDGATAVSVSEGEIDVSANNGDGGSVSVPGGKVASISATATSVSVDVGGSVSNDPGLNDNGPGDSDSGSGAGEGGGGY